ncbi:MAG: TRAP transporter permease [Deltaproteobacteria bacterium]|nr:TRAP transporter permease [Deltaproteobacteria bacterium]MBW2152674.1 TRAP transporter permease [Deltaproteobacteria bacterium]
MKGKNKALSFEKSREIVMEAEYGVRRFTGKIALVVALICILMSLYHFYTAGWGVLTALKHRSIHLTFAVFLCFLFFPAKKGDRSKKISWTDFVFACIGASSALYTLVFFEQVTYRVGIPTRLDLVMGAILTLSVMEAARRSVSPALPAVCLFFLAYAYFGPYLPDIISHKGYSIRRILNHLYLTNEGIYSVPVGVASTFVYLFVLFGAFLERVGAGRYLIDISFATMGKFRGGPAKAAVVASGMLGMASGSSIANTVTTGTLTIPLMKKVGFKPEIAGAVEVAASTNGQLMPPIMGAAAFIMAEFTGIPYLEIVKAAFIPAVLSYTAIFSIIHLEALKSGIRGLPKAELPPIFSTFIKGAYYLIPIGLLIYLLVIVKLTPLYCAFYSIISIVVIGVLRRFAMCLSSYRSGNEVSEQEWKGLLFEDSSKTTEIAGNTPSALLQGLHLSLKDVLDALEMGARNMIGIASACAACGIIIGVVTLTGLGLKMTLLIVTLAQEKLALTLIFAMIASIILGMGLPTTATYIMMAAMTAPAIIEIGSDIGIPIIAAHLFVFYYGIVADDTPPVGLCAYAAAGIAQSDPLKTGINSFRLDAAAFTLPFIYLYNTQLLMIDVHLPELLYISFTAIVGMFSFSAGIQGFLITRAKLWERFTFFVIAIALIKPGFTTDLLGFAGLGSIYFLQKRRKAMQEIQTASPETPLRSE